MKFYVLFGVLAVVFGSAICFRLETLDDIEDIEDDRIIGGSTAKPNQFPHIISLRGRRDLNGTDVFRHRCGGSILSDRWIITAAHCTQGNFTNASNLVVVVGAHHIVNDGETYQVQKIINHDDYSKYSVENDIAVLQTSEAIQFNDAVQPIALRGQYVEGGSESIISGWGAERLQKGKPAITPDHLKFVQVYTLSNDECRENHSEEQAELIYDGALCTLLAEGEGACFGDSGGPLTTQGQLIGLVSWGVPCAVGRPDQFTRISAFLDWIQENTGITAKY